MEITSWGQAIAAGDKRYFTGKPCVHGHLCERRTDTRACLMCARERAKKVPPEVKKDRFAAYYEKNSEKLRAKRVAYYAENKDQAKAYASQYRKANPEKILVAQKKWREANPNYKGEYRELNLDLCRSYFRNRFARKKAANGTHTGDDIAKLYKLQCGKCACCGTKVSKSGKEPYHVDHVTPLAKGGGNGPDNLQILCGPCNLKKGSKCPYEWAHQNGRLL